MTPEQTIAAALAAKLPPEPTREAIETVLRIAYGEGYNDALRADLERLSTRAVEFPLRGAA